MHAGRVPRRGAAARLTHDKLRRRILGGLARGTSKFATWLGTLAKDVGFGREQIGELRLTLLDGLADKHAWPELSEQLLPTSSATKTSDFWSSSTSSR